MDNIPEDLPDIHSSKLDLSQYGPDDIHQIKLYADAILLAEQRRREEDARLEQEASEFIMRHPEVLERYDKPYFWTRIIEYIWLPTSIVALVVVLAVAALKVTVAYSPQATSTVILISIVLLTASLWYWSREFVLGKFARPIVDEDYFTDYVPRVLALGLLGSRFKYPREQVQVEKYYASFWNFLPGWNSWVVSLDTPAQNDQQIHRLVHVRDGEQLVNALTPGKERSKRKVIEILRQRKG